jgi:hypothetical protein
LKMSSLKSRLTRMKVPYASAGYVLPKSTAEEPELWMQGLFDFGNRRYRMMHNKMKF